MRFLSTILVISAAFVAVVVAHAAPAAGSEEATRGDGKAPAVRVEPEKVLAAIGRVREAPAEARRAAVLDLVALGPSALDEVRKARDGAADAGIRAALDRAAGWILAAKMKPILSERGSSNLTFDGQYDDLKAEGPEASEALVLLVGDEESDAIVRLAAVHALADLRDPRVLPALRKLEEDPLLAFRLREEAGIVMAILGDTSRIDRKIRELAGEVESRSTKEIKKRQGNELWEIYRDNTKLSNLYYRIRQYGKAVACYDRALKALEELHSRSRSTLFREDLALTYYNAACSLTLNGEVDRAKEMLKKAVETDPRHLKSLEKDGDLRKLREAPGYEEFKRELGKPIEGKSI
jgi:tetratricopeptide (TPR) repeat protein